MSYDPNDINPPEPQPWQVAECVYCQTEITKDEAVSLPGGQYVCDDYPCIKGELLRKSSENHTIKHGAQRLVEQATHGLTYNGNRDWGRWDYSDDKIPGFITLKSNNETGQFRLYQLGGIE